MALMGNVREKGVPGDIEQFWPELPKEWSGPEQRGKDYDKVGWGRWGAGQWEVQEPSFGHGTYESGSIHLSRDVDKTRQTRSLPPLSWWGRNQ